MAEHQRFHDAPEVVHGGYESPQVNYGEGIEIAQPGKEVLSSTAFLPHVSYKAYDGKEVDFTGRVSNGKICGLRRRWFWIVLMGAIIIVAGAVGGGVGGALGHKSSSKSIVGATSTGSASPQSTTTAAASSASSSSSTPSITTSQTPSTTTVTVAVATDMSGCPLINSTIFTAPSGSKFKKICYYDILATNIDIHEVSVTSFDSCIGLCDSYNTENGKGSCKSVVWDMTGSDLYDCWLKNSTTKLTANGLVGTANSTVAAILQS